MGDVSFLEDASSNPLALDEVMQYVNALQRIQGEIEDAELRVKNLKEQENRLAKEVLPQLLETHGLEELKLANGKRLAIKESLYCRLPEDAGRRAAALEWLEANGGGDKIRDEVTIDGVTPDVLAALSTLHADYSRRKTVNTNSLQAWFRDCLGLKKNSMARINLEDVPKDFGVFVSKTVSVS